MPRFSSLLHGRDTTYFELFEAAAANCVEASGTLVELLGSWPDKPELVEHLAELETRGDRLTHDVVQRINQTFVAPLDREDVLELTSALDDVVDEIEEVAAYLQLYRIEAPMTQALEMADVLHAATRELAKALPLLRGFGDLTPFTIEVNRLENEGDRLLRAALAALFGGGIDPMVVIRWKDVFERLEAAIDACEHAANVLETVTIKNR